MWRIDVFCLSWKMSHGKMCNYVNILFSIFEKDKFLSFLASGLTTKLSFSEHTVCPLVLCPKRPVPNPEPNPVPVVLDVGVPKRPVGFWPNADVVVCNWPNSPGVAALLPNKLPKKMVKEIKWNIRILQVHCRITLKHQKCLAVNILLQQPEPSQCSLYYRYFMFLFSVLNKKSLTPLWQLLLSICCKLDPVKWNLSFTTITALFS